MIVDEGSDFKGWQVDFGLPDDREFAAFVPKVQGFPASTEEKPQTKEPEANCTCLELTDDVGYVRIKSFAGRSVIDSLSKRFIRKDRSKIRTFLNRSEGKYSKLIIDIRNNGGGLPQYGYDALIAPLLDEPVTYSQVVGVKTRYLAGTDESILEYGRQYVCTKKEHVIRVIEFHPPEEFDPNQWTFYEVTRRIEPRHRYNFKGDLYFLMNRGCFSAADDILNAVKRIGFATLVGRNTGGGASGYFAPTAIALPASGMIFGVETDVVINPDGSYNEITGTPPDIELPPADPPASITKEDLLEDEWIKWILADGQDRTDREWVDRGNFGQKENYRWNDVIVSRVLAALQRRLGCRYLQEGARRPDCTTISKTRILAPDITLCRPICFCFWTGGISTRAS